jgi:hypothetical protein
VLAICVLVWHQVLLPIYSDSEATVMEKVIGGAYPLTDLLLFFGLVAALSEIAGPRRAGVDVRDWRYAVADIAYGY